MSHLLHKIKGFDGIFLMTEAILHSKKNEPISNEATSRVSAVHLSLDEFILCHRGFHLTLCNRKSINSEL